MLYPFCLEDARLLSGDGSIRVHKEMVGVRKLYGGLRMLEWPGGREFNKLQLSFRSTIQYSVLSCYLFRVHSYFFFLFPNEREDICVRVYFHRSAVRFPFQEFTGRECVTCVRLSAYYNLPSSS
jgi:hypothetical protein